MTPIDQLKSVLCDPEGKCCIAGSDEDRAIVDRALEALAQPPLPEQEPLEYWNAVEGWVKIDEVREHFDAVNCGTIYKHGGEGRVPLYTAPPQQQAEPPPEWLLIKNILDEYGLQALDFVAEFKAAQQQAEPVAWDKPSDNFNYWWDGDRRRDNANPFTTDSFAYWAWEGWQAALAQRPWQGLNDVDVKNLELTSATSSDVRNISAELKEKNT